MFKCSLVVSSMLFFGSFILAQDVQQPSAERVEANKILKQAGEVVKEVKAVTYDYIYTMSMTGGSTFKFEGDTKLMRKNEAKDSLMHVKGSMKAPEGIEGMEDMGELEDMKIQLASNGKNVFIIDSSQKVFLTGDVENATEILLGDFNFGVMVYYIDSHPFDEEISSTTATIFRTDGQEKVGDVVCDTVYIEYPEDQLKVRWYIGKDDHLIYGVDRTQGEENEMNPESMCIKTSMKLSKVNTKAELKKEEFTLTAPEGYTSDKLDMAGPEGAEPELIAVGTEAPGWTLKDADGKDISLKDLRGNVVLLDFWATWCGPCKRAMPAVQKLHELFKDKPVKIYGVNTWEGEDADPAQFMKDNKYTYGLLLKGDDVAKEYKVPGIPTFYLIGIDGKILYNAVGFDPKGEDKIKEMIEEELKKLKDK